MECVEAAALKSSLRKDMALKLTPQTFLEELSSFNAQNIASSCDDFFVDDLLDFSHEEEEEGLLEGGEEPEQQQNRTSVSVSPQHNNQNQSHQICHHPLFNDHLGSLPTCELSVPAEDAADLEWLSYFVEDSFSENSISFPTGTVTQLSAKAPEPEESPFSTLCFKTPVPAKARSKRTRTGVRVWPLRSPSFAAESSSSTSSSSSSFSSPSSSVLVCTGVTEQCCSGTKPPPEKKAKRRAVPEAQVVPPRRCSHCGVQKTPQWRTGPLGAKTLCNACGVRYKSGRLLPEYRPACSPTFSSELHSNHHRKVLEMRRTKEVAAEQVTGLAPPPIVPGF